MITFMQFKPAKSMAVNIAMMGILVIEDTYN